MKGKLRASSDVPVDVRSLTHPRADHPSRFEIDRRDRQAAPGQQGIGSDAADSGRDRLHRLAHVHTHRPLNFRIRPVLRRSRQKPCAAFSSRALAGVAGLHLRIEPIPPRRPEAIGIRKRQGIALHIAEGVELSEPGHQRKSASLSNLHDDQCKENNHHDHSR